MSVSRAPPRERICNVTPARFGSIRPCGVCVLPLIAPHRTRVRLLLAMAGEMDRVPAAVGEEEEVEVAAEVAEEDEGEVAAEVAEEEHEAEGAEAEDEEEEGEDDAEGVAAPAVVGAGAGAAVAAAGALGGGLAPVPLGGAAAVLHAAAMMPAPFDAIAAKKAEAADNARRNKRLAKDRTVRFGALCGWPRVRGERLGQRSGYGSMTAVSTDHTPL